MDINKEILLKIKQAVYNSDPEAEIILYGSRARKDFNKVSDWDLLVLLNTSNLSFDLETKLMDDIYELEIETGEIISEFRKNWTEDKLKLIMDQWDESVIRAEEPTEDVTEEDNGWEFDYGSLGYI